MSEYPKRLKHPDSPGEAVAKNAADEAALAEYGWIPAEEEEEEKPKPKKR